MSAILTEKALLVELRIGNWSGRRYDPSASLSLADTYRNDPEYARVNKAIIAKDEIKKILRVVNMARRVHYEMTLPWGDGGLRLLPGELYLEYSRKIGSLKQQFVAKVEKFCLAYPRLVKAAQGVLNGLFNPDDYPSIDEVRRKFSFDIHFSPISDASDLRVKLQAHEVDKLRRDIESRQGELQEEAMRSLWKRLYEVIRPLAEKLNDPTGIFRDSLVGNVHDLVTLLPSLNVTQDPELTRMANEVRRKLCGYSPEELRKAEGARGKAARDADEILERMKGYVGKAA